MDVGALIGGRGKEQCSQSHKALAVDAAMPWHCSSGDSLIPGSKVGKVLAGWTAKGFVTPAQVSAAKQGASEALARFKEQLEQRPTAIGDRLPAKFRSLYNLNSQRAGELVLTEGEILVADTRVDDNWYAAWALPLSPASFLVAQTHSQRRLADPVYDGLPDLDTPPLFGRWRRYEGTNGSGLRGIFPVTYVAFVEPVTAPTGASEPPAKRSKPAPLRYEPQPSLAASGPPLYKLSLPTAPPLPSTLSTSSTANANGPALVPILDLDETLIVFNHLVTGKYAGSNPGKNKEVGAALGGALEAAIFNLCDEQFFFTVCRRLQTPLCLGVGTLAGHLPLPPADAVCVVITMPLPARIWSRATSPTSRLWASCPSRMNPMTSPETAMSSRPTRAPKWYPRKARHRDGCLR